MNNFNKTIVVTALSSMCSFSVVTAILDWQTLNKQFRQTQREQFNADKNPDAFQDYLNAHPGNTIRTAQNDLYQSD